MPVCDDSKSSTYELPCDEPDFCFVRNELRVFGCEVQRGRCRGIDCRNFVQQVCEPHELGVVCHVEAENGIIYNFVAYVDLFGNGFFRKVHDCSPDIEVFIDGILQVKP